MVELTNHNNHIKNHIHVMFSSCVISFQISHRTRQFKNKLSCTNWTPIMKYGLRTHTHTCDSWMHRRQKGVSAATNTERFRISWHTSHIITFTAFSQWLSPFRNICGHLSCGAASIMLRSKATILTINLVCVCCSSSVLGFFFKKKAFYSLNTSPDTGQNMKILGIRRMKTLSG